MGKGAQKINLKSLKKNELNLYICLYKNKLQGKHNKQIQIVKV